MQQPTTISFKDALEQGIVTTYEAASPEQAAMAKTVLEQLASMDIATVNDQGTTLKLFIISLMGDGYDVTVSRRADF